MEDRRTAMKYSIVIPSTRPKLLKQALGTIEKQTCDSDFEVCVFANGSLGQTRDIVNNSKIKNIKLAGVSPNEKLGMIESWNKALALASGEYVTLIGDDDGLTANAVELWNLSIDNNPDDIDVVALAAVWYGHKGLKSGKNRENSVKWDRVWPNKVFIYESEFVINELYNFRRPIFSQTHILFRNNENVCAGPMFPDYHICLKALASARKVLTNFVPTIIHGYSDDSSAELLLSKRNLKEKWTVSGQKNPIQLSPFSSHTFTNGWLETSLICKIKYDYFRDYDPNMLNFLVNHIRDIQAETLERDTTDHVKEIRDYYDKQIKPMNLEGEELEVKKSIALMIKRLEILVSVKAWESYCRGLFNDWHTMEGVNSIVDLSDKIAENWIMHFTVINLLEREESKINKPSS